MKELKKEIENNLVIKKVKTYSAKDGRQVRVTNETYEKVKELSVEANMNIGDISEIIMDWAIDRVIIKE